MKLTRAPLSAPLPAHDAPESVLTDSLAPTPPGAQEIGRTNLIESAGNVVDGEVNLAAGLVGDPEADQRSTKLPEEWQEILGDLAQHQSTLEAATLVLRAELQGYRESLIDLETHIRVVQMNLNEVSQLGVIDSAAQAEEFNWHESLKNSRNQIQQLQQHWCARLLGTLRVLRAADCPHDLEDIQDGFLQALQHELTEQENEQEQLARLPGKVSDREAVLRLLSEVKPLLSHCHALEPLLQTTLIAIMVRQDRLSEWGSHEFTDSGTHLRNRAGLELWLRQWRADEGNRQRQISAIMIDVDSTEQLNQQWGTRIGDVILNSLGTMINGVLRKNRGIDFTVRCAGQRYLVVLADTGPRGANSAAERIRQTIEQCYFEHPSGRIQVTISAGVSDIRSHDSLDTLFDRLQRTLRTAKQAGRNCAALDEGTGPICLMAPQLRIREHSAATTIQEVEQELLQEQGELEPV